MHARHGEDLVEVAHAPFQIAPPQILVEERVARGRMRPADR